MLVTSPTGYRGNVSIGLELSGRGEMVVGDCDASEYLRYVIATGLVEVNEESALSHTRSKLHRSNVSVGMTWLHCNF